MSEHIIEVTKALLAGPFLVLDVCMHLGTFLVDVGNDLLLIGDASSLLFYKTICDTFDLSSNRVQSIVVVLNSILLFLDNSSFKFIPNADNTAVLDHNELLITYILS